MLPPEVDASKGAGKFNFNRTLSPHTEQVAVAVWEPLSGRVDEARDKFNGPYVSVVEDRSSLRMDDRYLGAWQSGSLHVTAMSAAVDALHHVQTVLRSVVSEGAGLPMSALYPVLRTAVESASLAIYLLEPTKRDERLRRSFWVAAEDAKYADSFAMESSGAGSGGRLENVKREIRELIHIRPSLGDPASFKFLPVKYSHLVAGADAAIAADPAIALTPALSALALWQLMSGLSHGKQWAFISALDRQDAIVDETNQTALVKMTSSAAVIAVAMTRAVEVLEIALRLYGQRSKAAWNQPEDAAEPPTEPFGHSATTPSAQV